MPDSAPKPEPRPAKNLSRSDLLTEGAAAALGSVAAGQLWQCGTACLWLNRDGLVELLPNHEAWADSVTEPEAVNGLTQRGYTQNELVTYLRGRDWRLRLRQGG